MYCKGTSRLLRAGSQRRARCVEKSLGFRNNCSAADAHYVFAVQRNPKSLEPRLGHAVIRQFTAEVGLGAAARARMTPANDNGTCDFDVGQRLREEEQRYFCPGA